VDYASCGTIRSLGIKLYCGANRYGETKVLTDANYFEVYDCDAVNFNLDPNDAYFQSKTITNTLYDYLRCNTMKEYNFQQSVQVSLFLQYGFWYSHTAYRRGSV
jgi:hypothetical protein